uniref:Uncharacterized protein n=1 Tax=Anguilla anguilla TaxID=7936 RepID=A0A0E9P5L3_ANGAN
MPVQLFSFQKRMSYSLLTLNSYPGEHSEGDMGLPQ